MKKFILVASVAIFGILAMTSCKKEYTCECTFDAGVTVTNEMQSFPLGKLSKKDAKASCEAAQTTWSSFGAKCSIK